MVLAGHRAVPPPGIDSQQLAAAALADSYEVLADLEQVAAGIAGEGGTAELLWPGSLLLPATRSVRAVADAVADRFDELVVVPADVPDLPGLVLAKVFKALLHADVVVAPESGGPGCAALGVRLPWPAWLPDDLTLDQDPTELLRPRAPRRRLLAQGPAWHRLRTPAATDHLDPGLEGWEQTRAVLSGRPLGGRGS